MFDPSRALADMASQIRACRSADGLTLQQLATRSGVAASTIHKVEARQMVPTVSVLLKIAKGLGCRPEELIRDRLGDESAEIGRETPSNGRTNGHAQGAGNGDARGSAGAVQRSKTNIGVWRIDLSREQRMPALDLEPRQRAILLVEHGAVEVEAGDECVRMDAGDCIEVEGGRLHAPRVGSDAACVTLIVTPPGNLAVHLGQPRPAPAAFS